MLIRVIAIVLLAGVAAAQQPALPEIRLTPGEVASSGRGAGQVGGSGATGAQTRVLFGDPASAGLYAIVLTVPPHTTIQAHSHRDNRMATVVSGTWRFGYGDRFDETRLKTLTPGSVYSEPGGRGHFARSDNEQVVVQITGYGPTDTHYIDPANEPGKPK